MTLNVTQLELFLFIMFMYHITILYSAYCGCMCLQHRICCSRTTPNDAWFNFIISMPDCLPVSLYVSPSPSLTFPLCVSPCLSFPSQCLSLSPRVPPFPYLCLFLSLTVWLSLSQVYIAAVCQAYLSWPDTPMLFWSLERWMKYKMADDTTTIHF